MMKCKPYTKDPSVGTVSADPGYVCCVANVWHMNAPFCFTYKSWIFLFLTQVTVNIRSLLFNNESIKRKYLKGMLIKHLYYAEVV